MPRPSLVWGSEFFSASYPPVIYDYPADKIFSTSLHSCDFFENLCSLVTQIYAMKDSGISLIKTFFGYANV